MKMVLPSGRRCNDSLTFTTPPVDPTHFRKISRKLPRSKSLSTPRKSFTSTLNFRETYIVLDPKNATDSFFSDLVTQRMPFRPQREKLLEWYSGFFRISRIWTSRNEASLGRGLLIYCGNSRLAGIDRSLRPGDTTFPTVQNLDFILTQ